MPPSRDDPGRPGARPQPASSYRLAFASDRDGDFDIYAMNADGSRVQRLTDHPAAERDPEWSPDGASIAFVRLDNATKVYGDIYVMDAGGTNRRYVTSGGGPKWSPDGRTLAFHDLSVGPGESHSAVWVINANGTGRRKVASRGGDPSWTRDGRRIVYGGLQEGIVNVYSIALDGSGVRKISDDPVYACEPEMSPDGSFIAHVAGAPTRIQVVSATGSGARRLTDGAEWEFAPSWSPDGAVIAFARDPDSDVHHGVGFGGLRVGTQPTRIVIVNADGTGERTVAAEGYSDTEPSFRPRAP